MLSNSTQWHAKSTLFRVTLLNYSEWQVFTAVTCLSERNMKLRQCSKAQLWTGNQSSCQSLPHIPVPYTGRSKADDSRKYELVFCLFSSSTPQVQLCIMMSKCFKLHSSMNTWLGTGVIFKLDQSVKGLIGALPEMAAGWRPCPSAFGPGLRRSFEEKMGWKQTKKKKIFNRPKNPENSFLTKQPLCF